MQYAYDACDMTCTRARKHKICSHTDTLTHINTCASFNTHLECKVLMRANSASSVCLVAILRMSSTLYFGLADAEPVCVCMCVCV